jgi:hypothetical protein
MNPGLFIVIGALVLGLLFRPEKPSKDRSKTDVERIRENGSRRTRGSRHRESDSHRVKSGVRQHVVNEPEPEPKDKLPKSS